MFSKILATLVVLAISCQFSQAIVCTKDPFKWASAAIFNPALTSQFYKDLDACVKSNPRPCQGSCDQVICSLECGAKVWDIADECGDIQIKGLVKFVQDYVTTSWAKDACPSIVAKCAAQSRVISLKQFDVGTYLLCGSQAYNFFECMFAEYNALLQTVG